MFFFILSSIQFAWVASILILEKLYPSEILIKDHVFSGFILFINIIFLFWLKFIIYLISEWPYRPLINIDAESNYFLFYLIYSFVNYWWHRAKHSIPVLWTRLHYLHHYPGQMQSLVAFLRHPNEVLVNTFVIIIISSIIFDFNERAVFGALVIESMLEVFHHSNLTIFNKYKWIKYIIQTPDMHLEHHEKGKHKNNYSPLAIYDYIFHTWHVPIKRTKLGLTKRNDIFERLFKF